ncbi:MULTISPECIES: Ti-type conjugative transfer relaxase TraA [unclassified Ensifer]|uniref:Ti-type conjugative transfer relaxase TraA n=1 Tax=unclassified Ensifer TaxID=2633371 RepID=UPI000812E937|nr:MULTISPECIES: Ti-type conjugative transfer relaxase TraA [unclassified Ensifer]OCP21752.1 Ti-type conjugative transfer relaxase TraA [Ensifer sp. LC384]OCP22709.1 Ti-type conjugative transfer relaxase TraA [Ensifer sp. LC54]
MAIMFVRAQVISRGAGRSIISAAAYRHRTKMVDEQIGKEFRYYGGAAELVHEELALPAETPAWLKAAIDGRTIADASKALWNAVDRFETRCDAQLAREIILALPVELSRKENIELVRDFVRENLTSRGMVADWVYHDKDGNPHIHIMATLRPLAEEGFGPKKVAIFGDDGQPVRVKTPDRPEGKIVYRLWAGDKDAMKKWKVAWAETASRHLALAGYDLHLDGRSYDEQGLRGLEQRHFGPDRAALVRKGIETYFSPTALARRYEIADRLTDDPTLLLKQLTSERSTFNERDIARALHRYIEDPIVFANVRARLMASDDLVILQPQRLNSETSKVERPAVFTTRALVRIEYEMARVAIKLSKMKGFGVSKSCVDAAVASIGSESSAGVVRLAAEQIDAVRHVTAGGAITAVVGVAGAGKSTMLSAARTVWEMEGRRVVGAALAGKAAEGLEESSGIRARTIASWECAWGRGNDLLKKGDVLVVDEAGMVSSQQMGSLLKRIEDAGAKAVLIGDPMQLQPIQAGAAFRAIVVRISSAELAGVRRQKEEWARTASKQFARGDLKAALAAYGERGHIVCAQTRQGAIERIVGDWTDAHRKLVAKAEAEGRELRGDELIVLAHTNDDVEVLNRSIRNLLSTDGLLSDGRPFLTERGMREFAVGDRIIFLENARFVAPHAKNLTVQHVRNGMLGTVRSTAAGSGTALLTVRLDNGREVFFAENTYRNVDHGYAATIHKSQGSTFNRAFVLASGMMDQHLTYVAMTRHRDRADLYAAAEDFQRRPECDRPPRADYTDGVTGELVETGFAKFRPRDDLGPSPYADLSIEDGMTHRLWGVSLPKALKDGGVQVGDTVMLRKDGTEKVTVKVPVITAGIRRFEVRVVERNVWTADLIEKACDRQLRIAKENRLPDLFLQLVRRLSRSGRKTTTLDYVTEDAYRSLADDFAQRRGIEVVSGWSLVEKATRTLSWVSDQRGRVVRLWQRANAALDTAIDQSERIEASSGAATRQPTKIRRDGDPELLPATISFSRTLEEDARLAHLASSAWAERGAIIMPLLKRIYRDPVAALARLNEQSSNTAKDPQLIADGLARTPKALGNLRGADNLVDGLAARKERAAALSAVPELALLARARATEFRRQEGRFLNRERMRRLHMGFSVPALSKNARARLLEIEAAGEKGGDGAFRSAFRIATEDRSVVQEVKAIDEALTRRFGWLAFSDKADGFAKRDTAMRMPESMVEETKVELTALFSVVRRFAAQQRMIEKRKPAQLIAPAAYAPQYAVGRLPMLPAVTEFKNGVEDEARLRAVEAEHYRQERAVFGRDAVRIWRDPAAAVATIESLIAVKIDPERIVHAVVADPAAYGALRGSDRLWDRLLAEGRERREALQSLNTATASIRGMARSYTAAYEAELLAVSAERSRMSVAIPGLTKEAESELRRLTRQTEKNAKHLAWNVRAINPDIRSEFTTVCKALDARFGPGAFARGDRDVNKMVPKSQRAAFDAMRHRLLALQRVTGAYKAEEASAERQRRAIDQARSPPL